MRICNAHGPYEGESCSVCKKKPIFNKKDTKALIIRRNETIRAAADIIGVCSCCKQEKFAGHPWHVYDDRTYVCMKCYRSSLHERYDEAFWASVPSDNICPSCGLEIFEARDWLNGKCRRCHKGYCIKHKCKNTLKRPCGACITEKLCGESQGPERRVIQYNDKPVTKGQVYKRKAKMKRLPKDLICPWCKEEKLELILWTVTKNWVGCRICYGRN
jgi:hypothetical protein